MPNQLPEPTGNTAETDNPKTMNDAILHEFAAGYPLQNQNEADLLLWLLEWTSLPEMD